MLDLVLTDALVVTPDGPGEWDVGIHDGRIVALAARGTLDNLGGTKLSLAGKVVVPGGIDPHIHAGWAFPDPIRGTTYHTGGPDVVSRAALHGGTTTLIDFAIPRTDETLAAAIERSVSDWSKQSFCDFSFHVMLQGRLSQSLLDEVPDVIAAGMPSFKIYTTNVRRGHQGRMMPHGSIWELMQVTARSNGIIAVHAEDDDIVMHMYDKLIDEGRVGFEHIPLVHSSLSEDLSFRRVIRLAELTPGTALYMMHVSAGSGVEAIREARARGVPIYGETLHLYALRTQENYLESDGMKYHNYPSLKAKEDTVALWKGVVSGDIATFGTDELCTTYAVKTAGKRVDDVMGGNTGAEPRMSLLYTEVVANRRLGLKKFVDVTSANAARILGLYPRKGAVAVGSDADLAVFDPNVARKITAADLHESDYTPWEGWPVTAWPSMTILRGKVVVKDGTFNATNAGGKLIPRTLSERVRAGAAVG